MRLHCRHSGGGRLFLKLVQGEDRYFRAMETYEQMTDMSRLGKRLTESVIYIDTGAEDTIVYRDKDDADYSSDPDGEGFGPRRPAFHHTHEHGRRVQNWMS